MTDSDTISQQLMILSKLRFRKLFLVLSYIGRQKLEAAVNLDAANEIYGMKNLPMKDFEAKIWNSYGKKFCEESDRSQKYEELLYVEDTACQKEEQKLVIRSRQGIFFFVPLFQPLLIQCRLFYDGCAVKGTLLINRKLEPGTIQIRPSMIKVERDQTLPLEETFKSLEIVATSRKPGRNALSKYLIALLSYGGVPQEFFLNLLTNALEETRNVYSDTRAALRVASNYDALEVGLVARRMISSGIPLSEPYLQHCLSSLESGEKIKLKQGKLPVSESFYLMGTADPTGVLKNHEVCVILENGQISGKVLVYRNPGMHFGDVHVMEAVYKEELEEVVGNAKYGIFFSTKGKRSAAYEMATGDFDGDMYWVSRNPELLKYFKASEPWKRLYSTPADSKTRNPREFSDMELERELFQLFQEARKPSFSMATAADSWLTFMDRLLTLGDDRASEKHSLKKKIIQLIDIYYDALDAPKVGKRLKFLKGCEQRCIHITWKGALSLATTRPLYWDKYMIQYRRLKTRLCPEK
ncbi:UNVERIFIED_CONTAM: putative RNA-dependent RNA polymerase 5, partial [Sesamum angustifolium]